MSDIRPLPKEMWKDIFGYEIMVNYFKNGIKPRCFSKFLRGYDYNILKVLNNVFETDLENLYKYLDLSEAVNGVIVNNKTKEARINMEQAKSIIEKACKAHGYKTQPRKHFNKDKVYKCVYFSDEFADSYINNMGARCYPGFRVETKNLLAYKETNDLSVPYDLPWVKCAAGIIPEEIAETIYNIVKKKKEKENAK